MMASKGRVSTAPTHKRRVMLANSGLAALAVMVRGSSAMPQMGQAPGPSRTIWGCMGQVYSVRSLRATGSVASSAMPHLGQTPGFAESTSGCMGQVYWVDAVVLGADPIETRGARLRAVVFGRISLEFGPAALGTEIPGVSCVLDRCRRLLRSHLHAAHRIDFCQSFIYHAQHLPTWLECPGSNDSAWESSRPG